jgi:2-methylcitrate dehydratase PrpD
MIDRIDFVVDEKAEKAGYHKMTTIIDVTLNDGRVIHGEADFGKGSPANPMTYEEVAEKFRENADHGRLPRAAADEVVALVRDLEKQPSIERLMALVARAG